MRLIMDLKSGKSLRNLKLLKEGGAVMDYFMDDSFLRESKDRIRQEQNFRIVKLRVKNSHQNLPKNDAFRLIYWVSTKSDNLVLLTVYPKRGPLATNNLTNAEFKRLLAEMLYEKENCKLQRVDIANNLEMIENNCAW